MTLTEFLLARYAADESRFGPELWTDPIGDTEEWAADAGNRVLAQCAAGRRIIAKVYEQAEIIDGEWGCCHSAETLRAGVEDYGDGELVALPTDCDGLRVVAEWLSILALPYADHPDYREEWKP